LHKFTIGGSIQGMVTEVYRGPIEKSGLKRPDLKKPEDIIFEDIQIQWGKGEWRFEHPTTGEKITKPTFCLYNPKHLDEIVSLLDEGKTAAGMMMGNFGVFKKIDTPSSADELFNLKKRPKEQNFVVLIHPEDMINVIDLNRVPKPYRKQLLTPEGRMSFYAGPQHVILPVKSQGVNEALIRQSDRTVACFWVPNHFGFEGLAIKARERIKDGLIGGGSLNIHRKDPHYNKHSLYREMASQEKWLNEIDFIIFDDIAEAGNIGRSHTMVRYLDGRPEIIRIGSLSIDEIQRKTGHEMRLGKDFKYASSKVLYSEKGNKITDKKVEEVLKKIGRFNLFLQGHSVHK
jgi:tRNA A37 threonylcarbamoyladenosine synthetase subunit TsaC/SUA5/YrdC